MGQQANREMLINSDEIPTTLDRSKFVHVITDGGARPNPGSAGWGAIIRQNGKFAWTFGHCNNASNNAMELRAVIEALRCLPDGMHVWISTDSCYVKRGLVEWLAGWIAHNWRNSQGTQVANRSLWQKLIEEMNRMAVVQWKGGLVPHTYPFPLSRRNSEAGLRVDLFKMAGTGCIVTGRVSLGA
jgi:ribonuclease HI